MHFLQNRASYGRSRHKHQNSRSEERCYDGGSVTSCRVPFCSQNEPSAAAAARIVLACNPMMWTPITLCCCCATSMADRTLA